jgi:hypothetical protein
VTLLWFVELLVNRTKHWRRAVGGKLIGKDATVTEPCHPSGQASPPGRDLGGALRRRRRPGRHGARERRAHDLTLVVEPVVAPS